MLHPTSLQGHSKWWKQWLLGGSVVNTFRANGLFGSFANEPAGLAEAHVS